MLIVEEGLDHPPGKVSGPVASAEGSHYHIYIPKSLRKGRKAPLLHFNGSGGGNPGEMKRYLGGCERFGWILVASVESHNKTQGDVNLRHAANNIAALRESPLVDPKRIYFTGQSGGGAMSWWNARQLDGAGTLPVIGYIPPEIKVGKGHHFIIGGATDWNRYLGGRAAVQFGKDAFYRMYPGGHAFPKDERIIHEGIGWLTGKYLAANKADSSLANERLDYEAAMIDWIRELAEKEPWLGCRLGDFMEKTYGISGRNADILESLVSKFRQSQQNVAFVEGVKAIHEFGVKDYGSFRYVGTMNGKNSEAHAKALTRLATKFQGTPFVEETLREMAKPCQK
jgi:dienelactone hydrolase